MAIELQVEEDLDTVPEAEEVEIETDADEAGDVDDPTDAYDRGKQGEAPAATPPGIDSKDDLLAQISNAELKCKRAEWTYMERKQAAKEAKDELDGCVTALRRLCSQLTNDANRPLFSTLESPVAETVAAAATSLSAPAPDTAWRNVSIDELNDLSPATLEALRRGDVANMGELADLIARCEGGGDWPKGIGPKKQEQVIQSLNTWQDTNAGQDETVPVATIAWDTINHDMQCQYLHGRAARLQPRTPEELDEMFGNIESGELFHEGIDAKSDGDSIVNCPYGPTGDNWSEVDAWIAGWIWQDKQEPGE